MQQQMQEQMQEVRRLLEAAAAAKPVEQVASPPGRDVSALEAELERRSAELKAAERAIEERRKECDQRDAARATEGQQGDADMERRRAELMAAERAVDERRQECDRRDAARAAQEDTARSDAAERAAALERRAEDLRHREEALARGQAEKSAVAAVAPRPGLTEENAALQQQVARLSEQNSVLARRVGTLERRYSPVHKHAGFFTPGSGQDDETFWAARLQVQDEQRGGRGTIEREERAAADDIKGSEEREFEQKYTARAGGR